MVGDWKLGENGVRLAPNTKHGMTTRLWPVVAISLFCNFGNAQDGVAPVSTSYAVQGSLATSRAQNDADMQRALQRARETKALKDSMVAYAPTQRYYPVEDQLRAASLTANRPAVPTPASLGGGLSASIPVKVVKAPTPEIPEFEKPSNPSQQQAAPAQVSGELTELPSKKNGLLDRLFKREKEGPEAVDSGGMAPGASDLPPGPAAVDAATAEATGGVAVAPPSQGIPEPPSFGSTAPSPPGAGPAMAGEVTPSAPPAPAGPEEVAPIFQRRAAAPTSGETAAVKTESEANVAGVMVRLYEGDKVSVLSRNGSDVTIRLADQRVGTVSASVLAP